MHMWVNEDETVAWCFIGTSTYNWSIQRMLTFPLFKLWFVPMLFMLPPNQEFLFQCAFLLGMQLNTSWKETIWISSASLFVWAPHHWNDFLSCSFLFALILKQHKERLLDEKDGSPVSLPPALQRLSEASPGMCLEPGFGYKQLHSSEESPFLRRH